jgi:ceramide glucosyltransferase
LFSRYITIGKSMLFSKYTLKKIGGFEVFGNYLAEDHLLGKRIRGMGYKIVTVPVFVETVNKKWHLSQFLNRHTRWAKMRKNLNLGDYVTETLANPMALAFIYTFIRRDLVGVAILIMVALLKIIYDIYLCTFLKAPQKWRYYLLGPLKDLLLGAIWFIPLLSRKVNWRGNIFKIGKDTNLQENRRLI